jgi:prepilin signal peptidase PulO-like enzyme (type II secretory pathway)
MKKFIKIVFWLIVAVVFFWLTDRQWSDVLGAVVLALLAFLIYSLLRFVFNDTREKNRAAREAIQKIYDTHDESLIREMEIATGVRWLREKK